MNNPFPGNIEENYLEALEIIKNYGAWRDGRNARTISLSPILIRHDMSLWFPLLTTKRVPFYTILSELLWFITGSSDNGILEKLGCKIWNANANADYWLERGFVKFSGDCGRIYGVQWRDWKEPDGTSVDQLAGLIEGIRKDPHDRRHIVTAWNPGELERMALPPCHMLFILYSANGELSMTMLQRSCDMFLGVPFNIASYALLLSFIAKIVGQKPKHLSIILNDAHIYENHMDAVEEQLSRKPLSLPKLVISEKIKELENLELGTESGVPIDKEAVKKVAWLEGYESYPTIKAEMSV